MTTRWYIGPNDTLFCNGQQMEWHWLVGVVNQYEDDIELLRAVEDAAWALVDESANDIHTSDVVVHSAERQLEVALLALGQVPE